jgi:hypothetical protein
LVTVIVGDGVTVIVVCAVLIQPAADTPVTVYVTSVEVGVIPTVVPEVLPNPPPGSLVHV